MSVGKVIEITAESKDGFEAAIKEGIKKASKTVNNIQGAWIKEQKLRIEGTKVVGYRVDMKVTFLVD